MDFAESNSVAMGNDDICPDASWERSLQGRQLGENKLCTKIDVPAFKVKNCVVSIEKGRWYGFGPRARKVL